MFGIGEFHVRALFLLAAVGVLGLLRRPINYPDKPGSTWFALTVLSLSSWLGSVGLYYFIYSPTGSMILYNFVLFSITICFCSWLLVAIEFTSERPAPQWVLTVLGTFAVVHFALLWSNFFGAHELIYVDKGTFVDEAGGLTTNPGPVFWIHVVSMYVLLAFSTIIFVAEWTNEIGPRRRQAGMLAATPLPGVVASIIHFSEVWLFGFDPTPVGVTISVVLLGWALYRTEFLEITPVAARTIVDELPDAVVVLGNEGTVLNWNPAAGDLFNIDNLPPDHSAQDFFDGIPQDVLARLIEPEPTEIQVAFEVADHPRQFSVIRFPIGTDKTTDRGRVVVLRDITEIKQREKQLLRQNSHLEELTEIVTHDLRGSLMHIRGSATRIRTVVPEDADRILAATNRIEEYLSDMVYLTHAGRQPESLQEIEVASVAETAWRHVWSPHAELTVETETTVRGDPNRLQQLFENLFRNAVEHASSTETGTDPAVQGGPATGSNSDFSTSETRRGLQIVVGSLSDGFYVEDDGPGIPATEQEHVFEKGYSSTESGTGLGLRIVRQITEAHGWSVRATEGSTGGARFEVLTRWVDRTES